MNEVPPVSFPCRLFSTILLCHSSVVCYSFSPLSGVPVKAAMVRVSPVEVQCRAVSAKFDNGVRSVGYGGQGFSNYIPVWDSFN